MKYQTEILIPKYFFKCKIIFIYRLSSFKKDSSRVKIELYERP